MSDMELHHQLDKRLALTKPEVCDIPDCLKDQARTLEKALANVKKARPRVDNRRFIGSRPTRLVRIVILA